MRAHLPDKDAVLPGAARMIWGELHPSKQTITWLRKYDERRNLPGIRVPHDGQEAIYYLR